MPTPREPLFPESVLVAARAHAQAEYPRESCGLVVQV